MNKLILLALLAVPAFSVAHGGPVELKTGPVLEGKAMMKNTTGKFSGAEIHGGTASLATMMGKRVIKLSDDFKIPASPAPHFRIVDSKGNVYLLQRLTIVGGKTHRSVTLPDYIKDVKKVQIYCSFAEVVLGEASFARPAGAR